MHYTDPMTFELIYSKHGADYYGYISHESFDYCNKKIYNISYLHWLIMYHPDKVTSFTHANSCVNSNVNNLGLTPLMMAAKFANNIDIVKFLINSGADVNLQDVAGCTALMLFIIEAIYLKKNSSIETIREIIISSNVDVNLQTSQRFTALLLACKYTVSKYSNNIDNELNIIKLIIQTNDCDVNISTNNGTTPLMILCKHKNVIYMKDIIELLINNNANVDQRDRLGRTAIMYLLMNEQHTNNLTKHILILLINASNRNTILNSNDDINLFRCAIMFHRDMELIEILSTYADVNKHHTNNSSTILMWLCCTLPCDERKIQLLKLLINKLGADVTVKDNTGFTALMWLLTNGTDDDSQYINQCITILLDKYPPNMINDEIVLYGKRYSVLSIAIENASRNNNTSTLKLLLLNYNIDVVIKNSDANVSSDANYVVSNGNIIMMDMIFETLSPDVELYEILIQKYPDIITQRYKNNQIINLLLKYKNLETKNLEMQNRMNEIFDNMEKYAFGGSGYHSARDEFYSLANRPI